MGTPLRRATWDDLVPMAIVFAEAFKNENLFGQFLHPHRFEHWDDYVLYQHRNLRQKMCQHTTRVLVTVDEQTRAVTGFAVWDRWGEGAKQLPRPYSLRFWGSVYKAVDKISTAIWPDKAGDPAHIAGFNEASELFAHHWEGSRAETWYLDTLAVHPDHQGKRNGKQLVEMGIQYAREDGVVASLISTEVADSFYEKLGFHEVGRANIGPLSEIEGGSIKFLDPQTSGDELRERDDAEQH